MAGTIEAEKIELQEIAAENYNYSKELKMSNSYTKTIKYILLVLLAFCWSAGAKTWKIDFQGDSNHVDIYGQTDPVDMTEEGVVWNIFEAPALDAGYPGPCSYVTDPNLVLHETDGARGPVEFIITGKAWGWAGTSARKADRFRAIIC